jgi:hypothetical protein
MEILRPRKHLYACARLYFLFFCGYCAGAQAVETRAELARVDGDKNQVRAVPRHVRSPSNILAEVQEPVAPGKRNACGTSSGPSRTGIRRCFPLTSLLRF